MLTPADFKTEFPEFAGVTDPVIQLALTRSVPHFDTDRWGDKLDEGTGYWVAHRLAMGNQSATFGAGSGSSETKKVGDVSITRSATFGAAANRSYFDLTKYGKAYLDLIDSLAPAVLVI